VDCGELKYGNAKKSPQDVSLFATPQKGDIKSMVKTLQGMETICTKSDVKSPESPMVCGENNWDELLKPLVLSSPGPRSVVDETAALRIIEGWKTELQLKLVQINAVLGDDRSLEEMMLCERIVLSNKAYTAAAAKHIASFIAFGTIPSLSSQVISVDLSDIIASREKSEGLSVLKTFSDAFQSGKLMEIDLSDNAMGSKGISSCVSILSLSSLEKLALCNNGLSENSMNEVADILVQHKICRGLKKIHFYNNMSGDGGCKAFARILRHCGNDLVDIRFSGTRAQRQGSLEVAIALKDLVVEKNCNIEYLDLADNSFDDEGADALASSLYLCTNLKHLDVRDCLLGDSGIQEICHSIIQICPLHFLDISGNDITKNGAQHIVSMFQKTSSLRVFRALENELTSFGVRQIMKAMPESVEELFLGFNEVGSVGAAAIIRAKKVLKNLRILEVDGNMFSTEDVLALHEAFGDRLLKMEDNVSDDDADFDLMFGSDDSCGRQSSSRLSLSMHDTCSNMIEEASATNSGVSALSFDGEERGDDLSNSSTLSSADISVTHDDDTDEEQQAGTLMALEKEWSDLKEQSPLKSSGEADKLDRNISF